MSDDLFPDVAGVQSVTLLKEAVSKDSIKAFSQGIIDKANDGEIDALDVYIQTKIMTEYAAQVGKGLKELAEVEAAKYGKDDNNMYGCTVEQTSGATKYSYDHDEPWAEIQNEINLLVFKRKAREDLMKSAIKFSGVADEDGVEIPQAKVSGGSAASLRVTIPKS